MTMTLKQWLSEDPSRRVVIRVEAGEICANLVGESLTWRGRDDDSQDQAIAKALTARDEVRKKL